MKKKGLICLLLSGIILTGCGKNPGLKAGEIDHNALFVDKKGSITCGVVESFEKDYYMEEELKTCIDEWIESYNSTAGEDRVELKSFLVAEKEASMVVAYDTVEDYAAVNQRQAGILSFEEAKEQGLLPETLISAKDGSTVAAEDLEIDEKSKVLFLEEEYDAIVDGKVLYYQNGALKSTDKVHTAANEMSIIIYK